MSKPSSSEEYITIIDNRGREKIQRVEEVVFDVQGEKVYLTSDGLGYASDSLEFKDFDYLIEEFEQIPTILLHPEIVIYDHASPEDTLIYYRHLHIASFDIHQLIAVVVKKRQGIKFFYNMHPQESGKVKGYHQRVPPEVWYIAPGKKTRHFGLRSHKRSERG